MEHEACDDWVKKCKMMDVKGKRPRGRPQKTWMEVGEECHEVHASCLHKCTGQTEIEERNMEEIWLTEVDP